MRGVALSLFPEIPWHLNVGVQKFNSKEFAVSGEVEYANNFAIPILDC